MKRLFVSVLVILEIGCGVELVTTTEGVVEIAIQSTELQVDSNYYACRAPEQCSCGILTDLFEQQNVLSGQQCAPNRTCCIAPPPPPPPSPSPPQYESAQLNAVILSTVRDSFVTVARFVSTESGIMDSALLNHEELMRERMLNLGPYFSTRNFDLVGLAHDVNIAELAEVANGLPDDHMISSIVNANMAFSDTQMSFMDSYFWELSRIGPNVQPGLLQTIYSEFRRGISNDARMSDAEKVATIAMIRVGHEFAWAYWIDQRWMATRDDLSAISGFSSDDLSIASKLSSSDSASDCNVNWRQTWASAVAGGVFSGIRGAIIGGSGGTVALPGFGTVTGALSGAVFGFAGGFASGAITSVASDLILTCFRNNATLVRSSSTMEAYCREIPPTTSGPCRFGAPWQFDRIYDIRRMLNM
jgi:hypothetical protein